MSIKQDTSWCCLAKDANISRPSIVFSQSSLSIRLCALLQPCLPPSGNCLTLKLFSTFVIVAIPMEPSDCFLSLKVITFVLTLKLLALLATLRVALLIPLRSENWPVEVELVLEEDLELDSLFVLFGASKMFDLDLGFLFGTA